MNFDNYVERAQRQLTFIQENKGNSAKHAEVASAVQALFSTVNRLTSFWPSDKHAEGFDPICDLCNGVMR